MSTRANIILKDNSGRQIIFYRHSDGYPKGVMPTLNKFINWIKAGKIRNNLMQSAGWLVLIGAMEYNSLPKYKAKPYKLGKSTYYNVNVESIEEPSDWKCGAYEITDNIHGDIAYLYTVNVSDYSIKCQEVKYERTGMDAYLKSGGRTDWPESFYSDVKLDEYSN